MATIPQQMAALKTLWIRGEWARLPECQNVFFWQPWQSIWMKLAEPLPPQAITNPPRETNFAIVHAPIPFPNILVLTELPWMPKMPPTPHRRGKSSSLQGT